jgi:hypothetical protein
MTPAGYMAKRVASKPDWLKANRVDDIYSVTGCISKDFADYINFWKHNGYWLFDSPEIIEQIAQEHGIELAGTTMFYYEVYAQMYDEVNKQWISYGPEPSFTTTVHIPEHKVLAGFDVVNSVCRTSPECSLLSCNALADEIQTNAHCLLPDVETAKSLLEAGRFNNAEPGPYRIYAVYTV